MDKKMTKRIKLIISISLVILFIWFTALKPAFDFKSNEKKMEEAAKRYYEINEDKLPTGTRIKTLTLKDLYNEGYIEEDIYLPYSKEPCSITDSWVKTKQENGEYKHYVYLQCGALKSKVDHKGPTIILNGEDEITINKDDKYEELGVKKVTDNQDGKIDIETVTIDSSKVNTKKNGTYEVIYTVYDSFNNKTEKVRKVNVIQPINNVVKKDTKEGIYQGNVLNNYVILSGIKFRIVGIDSNNNVKLVTDKDIANINYSGINDWLDYFYDKLTDDAKKYIVKNKYCNDTVTIDKTDNYKLCEKTTKEKYVYLLSLKEMNESIDENKESYLFPNTISWLANKIDDNSALTTRTWFNGTYSKFYQFVKEYNFGIRPAITIKGDSLIKSGDGTINNPYNFKETKTGKADELLNTRHPGEYVTYSNRLFRITDIDTDGTVKVISIEPILEDIKYETASRVYNPTKKGNVGYTINQKVSSKLDTKYFVNKEIEVPIYKDIVNYKKETKTKKYKVKISAPNMYEIFSAKDSGRSYWLINSSQNKNRQNIVSDIGVIYYTEIENNIESNARIVGYLNAKCKITTGSGTEIDPYKITK